MHIKEHMKRPNKEDYLRPPLGDRFMNRRFKAIKFKEYLEDLEKYCDYLEAICLIKK